MPARPDRVSHGLRLSALTLLVGWSLAVGPVPLTGQQTPATATAIPGPEYQEDGLHRFLFGSAYRDLWTVAINVEVLDLARAGGGGLTPVGTGGGTQTLNLRFVGADGLPYTFRELNKDPTSLLPPDLKSTFAAALVQDQISSAFPSAPPVVDVLLAAVGIHSRETRLVILPDDPRLGSYRELFAGRIGTFEKWANARPNGAPGFANATEVIDTDELADRLRADPGERVNLPGFLTARLIDIYVGDWDRHRGQWRWGNVGPGDPPSWEPFPEDRDQAFALYDGLILWLTSRKFAPQLTRFGPKYPGMTGATWNGRDLDRWLLPRIDKTTWDSVAAAVQSSLTDVVINHALEQLPPAHLALRGDFLRRSLRQRRDNLPRMAEEFYRHIAAQVDLQLTDAPEVVDLTREADGSVTLSISRISNGRRDSPYLTRHFEKRHTREIRIHLQGGDDSLIVRGSKGGITLRILSEAGRNTVIDSSRAGGIEVYDTRPDSLTASTNVAVDRKPWSAPVVEPGQLPRRDWGSFSYPEVLVGYTADLGVLLAGSYQHLRFGFRQQPYSQKHVIGAAFSSSKVSARLSYDGSFVRRGTDTRIELHLLASGIEINNFYGLGNATGSGPDRDFFDVDQRDFRAALAYSPLLASVLRGTIGITSRFTITETDEQNFVSLTRPYGSDDFGQIGGTVALDLDLRDRPGATTTGFRIRLEGDYYPVILASADSGSFGGINGFVAGYVTPVSPLTIGLRVGGQRIWGTFPFHEAAFLGGESTLRGYRQQRFGGEASLYLNTDVRLRLGDVFLLIPTELGLIGLFDAGQVWFQDVSDGDAHVGVGGGIYLAPLGRRGNALVATVAGGDDGTLFALHMGFAF